MGTRLMTKRDYRADTLLGHLGRDPKAFHGAVNIPVYHASTILFDNLDAYDDRRRYLEKGKVNYGLNGTPTTFALEEAVAKLECGSGCIAVSSGLAAITCAILALVECGDHILVSDSVYQPTRKFCDGMLRRLGVETSYYDPTVGADIAALIRPNTRLVFLESPGSLTFEVQDVPAIAKAAKAAGASVLLDSTWAASLLCRPFDLGADISIQAGTKYVVGHSDAMLGLITTSETYEERVRLAAWQLGQCAGPDDVYLGLRGLRTLSVRLSRHQETGLTLARWLAERPEVERVLHPGLPGDPGHEIWRRDFTGASGLFGVVLRPPCPRAAVAALIEGMALFGLGSSWGGYESLMIATYPERIRSATTWGAPGRTLRIHAGLEDPADLIADLEAGFERFKRAVRESA
jgi:cystathionine beta-lyase